jgi:hypothetical protein
MQKMEDILATLFQYLISEDHGGWLGVDMEVVLRYIFARAYDAASIVAEVEDVCLDT